MPDTITTKPFRSQSQWRMAFARGLPFARRWARETPGGKGKRYSKLPVKVKAPNYGARAGQTIAGRLVRGGDGKFTSGNNPSSARANAARDAALRPKKPTAPRGRRAVPKPKKPVKTPEQRAQEREAARQERARARAAEREQNIAKTFSALGLAEDAADSLKRLAAGKVVDDDGGLVKMGLAEQAKDGSYRLTATGRAVMNAAERGDLGAARDAKSRAQDRATEQAERAAAAEKKPAAGGAGGKKKPEKPPVARRIPTRSSRAPQRAQAGAVPSAGQSDNLSPQLTDAARALSEGRPADTELLIRNGLAKRDKQGRVTLTASGLRAIRQKTYKALRVVEHGGDTIQGNSTVHEAYGHAATYGEVSQQWLDMLLDRGWAYQVAGNGYALREPGEIVAKEPAFQAQLDSIRARNRSDFKSFTVYKDATGAHRWVAYSSNAYRDRDEEIVSTKALTDDCARADADRAYGPLRWWHVPGWELGDCDFNAMHGRVLVESGTFKSTAIGAAVARAAPNLQLSIGFTHAPDEPDAGGVFHHIRRFERSLVPGGRAANPFTRLIVKETRMDTEKEQALKAALGADAAAQVLAGAEAVQKDADDRQTAYKSADPFATALAAFGEVLKAAMQPTPPGLPVSTANLTIKADAPVAGRWLNNEQIEALKAGQSIEPEAEPVAEKAPPPMVEEVAEEVVEEQALEPMDDGGGEMTADEFLAQIGALIDAKLAPIAGLLDIEKKVAGHVASLMQPFQAQQATKDDETAALKATIAEQQARLELLEGDIPPAFKAIGGYRPSQALDTLVTKAQAEQFGAAPAPEDNPNDPFAEIRSKLLGSPNGHSA